jgi:hypothetical protein
MEAKRKNMKTIAIFAPELTGETAGTETSVPPGECPAAEPQLESSPPAMPVPSGATASPAIEREAPPPKPHVSVVAKVAKLLISRGLDPRLDHSAQSEDGFSHYKVLMSLKAKQLGQ